MSRQWIGTLVIFAKWRARVPNLQAEKEAEGRAAEKIQETNERFRSFNNLGRGSSMRWLLGQRATGYT